MISLRLLDQEYPFEGFDHVRFVARGIVMDRHGNVALHLLHRNDAFCDQTYYETPGGGVDEGESYVEAFARECKEELGADVDILLCLGEVEDAYNLIKRKNINRFFLAKVRSLGEPHFASKGDTLIQKTEWLPLEEAIAKMKAQDDRLVAGLVKRRELPMLEEVKRLRDAHRISYPGEPTHHGTLPLETKRLLLRRFEEADAEMMFANWSGDPDVTEFLEWPAHADVGVTRSVVTVWSKKYGDPTFYQWIIVKKENNEAIGSISVIHSDFDAVEIGYCIAKKEWNKHYTSEALEALLAYFFDNVNVSRVFGKTDVMNERGQAVMKNVGMAFKQTVPHGGFNQRGVCDVNVFEISKAEYQSRK